MTTTFLGWMLLWQSLCFYAVANIKMTPSTTILITISCCVDLFFVFIGTLTRMIHKTQLWITLDCSLLLICEMFLHYSTQRILRTASSHTTLTCHLNMLLAFVLILMAIDSFFTVYTVMLVPKPM